MEYDLKEITDEALISALRDRTEELPARDIGLAKGILSTLQKSGKAPSPKQRACLERFVKVLTLHQAPRDMHVIGDMSGIVSLFDRAGMRLKYPAVTIGIAGREIRLSRASESARVPGSINVSDENLPDDNNWYGRILRNGLFEKSPRISLADGLVEGLRVFSADPVKMAAEHGKLTGRCCFCNQGLTDERSTSIGYGPTCAENYGLPWGDRPASGVDSLQPWRKNSVRLRRSRSVSSIGD